MDIDKSNISLINFYILNILILFTHHTLMGIPLILRIISSLVVLFVMPGHLFSTIFLRNSLADDGLRINGNIGQILVILSISLVCLISFIFILIGELNKNVIVTFFLLSQSLLLAYLHHNSRLDKSFFLSLENIKIHFNWTENNLKNRLLTGSILFAIMVLSSSILVGQNDDGDWVEFYVTDTNDLVDTIPGQISVNDTLGLKIGIINHGITENFTITREIFILGNLGDKNNPQIKNMDHLVLSNSDYVFADEIIFYNEGTHIISYNLSSTNNSQINNSLQIIIEAF